MNSTNPVAHATRAAEENLFAYIRLFAAHKGNEYFEDDRVLGFVSGIGIPSMQSNSVYKLALGGIGEIDGEIRELLRPFRERKLPLFLTTGPSSSPPDLALHLKRNGIMHAQSQRGMAISLRKFVPGESPAGGLRVKRIETQDELKAWLAMYADGFDYPRTLADFILARYRELFFDGAVPAFHYIGYVKNKPVATSTLFITGKTAGLYNIITVPEARRRGIGTAMTITALNKGKELGCETGVLQATEMGAPVYRKLGFDEICVFDLYMKLYGKSRFSFPAGYVAKKISNSLRGAFKRM